MRRPDIVDQVLCQTGADTLFPNGRNQCEVCTIKKHWSAPDDKDGLNVVPNQTIARQDMDGRTLLNWARFRKDDEGGRTKRQQQ